METTPRLEFLKNEAGEREGLGDAGIETFKDAPYASCAREAGQNSLDARANLKQPVKLTFDLLQVLQKDFPDHSGLLAALESCASSAQDGKEEEFFSNALSLARRDELPVLMIADYNTTGLSGPPNEPSTPFHSLVKSTGVSTKESKTAGGSFGIGKNASFAVTDLQMVFYSTCYRTPDEKAFAAQGKVKLISHGDPDEVQKRATGYWGDPENYGAVLNPTLVPEWMRRNELGTSIFCAGFRESEGWAEHMTASLISNFFCAIHREEMIFEVDNGRFQINSNTLENLLTNESIRAAAEKSGHLADLEFATQLYRCLVSPDAHQQIVDLPALGSIQVRILTTAGMPRRIGFIRNGMLITDNLKHFGHALSRFPGSRDFIVLAEPADDKAGRLLKRLENPSHDGFSAQRISDPHKRSEAERAMKTLGRKLREIVKKTAGVEQSDATIIDELGQFFADSATSNEPSTGDTEPDIEQPLIQLVSIRSQQATTPSHSEGAEGGRSGTRDVQPSENGGGSGPLPGEGTGGSGNRGQKKSIDLKNVRNVILSDEGRSETQRILHFTSPIDGPAELVIEATGINASERLGLTSTDQGTLTRKGWFLKLKANERYSVNVTFADEYTGPIELSAFAQKEELT